MYGWKGHFVFDSKANSLLKIEKVGRLILLELDSADSFNQVMNLFSNKKEAQFN